MKRKYRLLTVLLIAIMSLTGVFAKNTSNVVRFEKEKIGEAFSTYNNTQYGAFKDMYDAIKYVPNDSTEKTPYDEIYEIWNQIKYDKDCKVTIDQYLAVKNFAASMNLCINWVCYDGTRDFLLTETMIGESGGTFIVPNNQRIDHFPLASGTPSMHLVLSTMPLDKVPGTKELAALDCNLWGFAYGNPIQDFFQSEYVVKDYEGFCTVDRLEKSSAYYFEENGKYIFP